MISAALLDRLRDVLPGESILLEEPMALHTTFRIGGPADALLLPKNDAQVIEAIRILRQSNTPYYVIGNGSNVLVRDGGFRGCIVKMVHQGCEILVDKERHTLYAGAGETMMPLARRCAFEGLGGLEFASGIPGTLGGTVSMNAGAYEKEMKDVIQSVRVLTQEGEVLTVSKDQMHFGYRTSAALSHGWIVLGATLLLTEAAPQESLSQIEDFTRRRQHRQPLEYPSAGSTFKRPEGHFAAKLIDEAGLKGFAVGDAEVSAKHAGFVVNKGRANAKDVLRLMGDIQRIVKETSGVALKPEVRVIGEDA